MSQVNHLDHLSIITAVNDLISSGKVKSKGAYEVLPYEKLGWHKNHSGMIIPLAVMVELLGFENSADFIKAHTDPFDFMMKVKVPRSSKLFIVKDGVEKQVQNICRYFPDIEGGKLIKRMPPLKGDTEWRDLGVDKDYTVKTCNQLHEFSFDSLNYDYYITKAQKLLEGVRTGADITDVFEQDVDSVD